MFFSNKKLSKLVAVIDVGSSSVGGALVNIQENTKPKIVFAIRKSFKALKDPKPDILLDVTTKTAAAVLEEVFNSKLGRPENVHFFLSSHLYLSQTRYIKLSKQMPITVDDRTIQQLVKTDLDNFNKEQLGLSNKLIGADNLIVEKKVQQISLNGYPTSKPYGQKATEITIAIYLGISNKKLIDTLRLLAFNAFHEIKTEFHSFSFSSFSVIRDTLLHGDNFVFGDIGGEITELLICRDGVLEETTSFPFGKNTLLRMFDDKSVFNLYHGDKLDSKTKEKMSKLLNANGPKFKNFLQDAFQKLSKERLLPQPFFIVVDEEVSSVFNDYIKDTRLVDFTKLGKPPYVLTLSSKQLEKFCNSKSVLFGKDVFLTILGIFVDKISK